MPPRRDAPIIQVRVGAPDNELQRIEDVDRESGGRIASLTFDDQESKPDKLSLVVDNFDLLHIDSPVWREGNRIEATWGYDGLLAPLRRFTIQKVLGSTMLKVECEADDVLLRKVLKSRTFENLKRSDVARTLAEEAGFGQADVQFIDDTVEVLEQITQARQSDYAFMMELAKREGFNFYIDFDGWHFHERKLDQKPLRTFIYYTDPDQGDIISWNKGDSSKAKPGKVRLRGRDPLRKKDIDVTADNSTVTDRVTLGASLKVVGPDDASEAGDPNVRQGAVEYTMPTTEVTEAAALRKAKAIYKRVQLTAIELEVKAWGDPRLVAKSVVGISGIGPTLSGLYYIKSVKHDVGSSGGYTMDMKLGTDGKATHTNTAFDELPGQGGGVAPKAPQNTKEADDKGGAAGGTDPPPLTPVEGFDPLTGQTVIVYKDAAGNVVKTP